MILAPGAAAARMRSIRKARFPRMVLSVRFEIALRPERESLVPVVGAQKHGIQICRRNGNRSPVFERGTIDPDVRQLQRKIWALRENSRQIPPLHPVSGFIQMIIEISEGVANGAPADDTPMIGPVAIFCTHVATLLFCIICQSL